MLNALRRLLRWHQPRPSRMVAGVELPYVPGFSFALSWDDDGTPVLTVARGTAHPVWLRYRTRNGGYPHITGEAGFIAPTAPHGLRLPDGWTVEVRRADGVWTPIAQRG